MTEILALLALDWPQVVMGAYWIGLIVGGGLVVLTLLSAGESASDTDVDFDSDFDADFDADVDADFDADMDAEFDVETDHAGELAAGHASDLAHGGAGLLSLSAWLSVRFFVYFAAVFGAVGIVFTYLTDCTFNTTLTIATAAGACIGQGVHHLMRVIKQTSGNTQARPRDFLYRPGRVTVAIAAPHKGEVAVEVRRTERFLPAVVVGATPGLGVGAPVIVVGYRGGIVQVVSREEYESKARPAR